MEENEPMEPSFGELIDLIKQYEEAVRNQLPLYFEEESYERIILFYQENREYNNALRVIETALTQYGFSSFFYTKKAEILANQRQFDEALDALQTAEGLDPRDVNVCLIRADVYLWQGKHTEALAEVEHGLSLTNEPGDLCELYLEMADIWEDQEKYPRVREALQYALTNDPQNEEAYNRLWFCTEITESYEQSIRFHSELIENNPYAYLAWYNLGHAYAGLDMYEKALEAFGFVTAINDEFDPGYVCSADVLYNMEQYNEALSYYLDAIKLAKPNKELYLKTAETYEKLGEYSKARTYLRKSLSVDPYFEEAFYKLGETYREESNWAKAISNYERAVKLDKENTDYLAALADAYMTVDEGEKAVELFERIFQLDPNTKQNWLNLATVYFNIDNYRKAFQVLSEACEKFDYHADIFYIKAVFYFQTGNRHEALINLERGLILNFAEHTLMFDMDETLAEDPVVLQVIEQYR